MLDYLTRTDGSAAVYLFKAFGTVIVGTVIVVFFASLFFSGPDSTPSENSRAVNALILLIVWPVMVTAMLQGLLLLARRFAPDYWYAAGGTALLLALAMGLLGGPAASSVMVWPFFIYAVVFLAWQLKSNRAAWAMTLGVQAMVNLLPVLFMK